MGDVVQHEGWDRIARGWTDEELREIEAALERSMIQLRAAGRETWAMIRLRPARADIAAMIKRVAALEAVALREGAPSEGAPSAEAPSAVGDGISRNPDDSGRRCGTAHNPREAS